MNFGELSKKEICHQIKIGIFKRNGIPFTIQLLLFLQVRQSLKDRGLLRHIETIVLLKKDHSTKVKAAISATSYINRNTFKEPPKDKYDLNKLTSYMVTNFKLVVFLKSKKVVEKDLLCTKKCVGESKCILLPFSTIEQCQCPATFDGDLCDQRSNTSFANDLNSMLKESITIPQLSDVFFEVKDIQEDIADGFGSINNALNNLSKTFKTAFQEFSGNMEKLILEQNLLIKHGDTLSVIQKAIETSNQLFRPSEKDIRVGKYKEELMINHAKDLIMTNKMRTWVSDLDRIFKGPSGQIIGKIPPLLEATMDKGENTACTESYKKHIDLIAKRFYLLQSETFMMYIQARNALKLECFTDRNFHDFEF